MDNRSTMSKFQIGDRVAFRKGMVESYNVGVIRGFEPATPGSRDVCALVRVEGYGRGEHCSTLQTVNSLYIISRYRAQFTLR